MTSHSAQTPLHEHRMDMGMALQWRHNERDGVSDHQPHDRLLNHLFRRRSKKTSKLRVTGLCAGKSPMTGDSPHKGPVTRKMIHRDDVIMDLDIDIDINMDMVSTLRPRRNRRHFVDDIFKYTFLNENEWISIEISLKFVPKGSMYVLRTHRWKN